MDKPTHTQIGCEVLIRKGNSILLGKRKNCYGAGTWALPGGHLEFNERLVDAMTREIQEEIGADIKPENLELVSIVDDLQPENGIHYLHASFELLEPTFEPIIMEPERCEEWRYFSLDELPYDNFFPPHSKIVENYLNKRLYL